MELWECAIALGKLRPELKQKDGKALARARARWAKGKGPKPEPEAMRDEEIAAFAAFKPMGT